MCCGHLTPVHAARLPGVAHVCRLFQESLGPQASVMADTNFFDAGGTSLTAGHLASKLRAAYSVRISASELFRMNTPALVWSTIEKKLPQGARTLPPALASPSGSRDVAQSPSRAQLGSEAAYTASSVLSPQLDHGRDGIRVCDWCG